MSKLLKIVAVAAIGAMLLSPGVARSQALNAPPPYFGTAQQTPKQLVNEKIGQLLVQLAQVRQIGWPKKQAYLVVSGPSRLPYWTGNPHIPAMFILYHVYSQAKLRGLVDKIYSFKRPHDATAWADKEAKRLGVTDPPRSYGY